MSKWPMVPLGEIVTQDIEATTVAADQEYPNLGIYSFGRGLFEKQPISGTTTSAKHLYRVKSGQFIYSRLFAFEGAYGLVGDDLNGHFVSNEYPHFDCDPKRVLPEFLAIYFRASSTWEKAATLTTGMGDRRRRIKPEQLIKMEIPLPPLSEQQKIVEWIDAMANRVEEAKELREQASNASESLWKGLKKRLLDQAGTAGTRELGDIVRITGGGTPSKQNPLFWDGDIPWISPKDMKSVNIDGAIDSITEAGIQNSSAKLLPKDAVLIVIRGMILAHTVPVGLLKVPATINQDMKALIPNDGILPSYLCHALWSLNEELLKLVDRSTHDTRKLTTPKLLSFRIPVPDIDVQTSFVNESEEVNSTIQTAASLTLSSQRELEALLPSALNQVFDGAGHG